MEIAISWRFANLLIYFDIFLAGMGIRVTLKPEFRITPPVSFLYFIQTLCCFFFNDPCLMTTDIVFLSIDMSMSIEFLTYCYQFYFTS